MSVSKDAGALNHQALMGLPLSKTRSAVEVIITRDLADSWLRFNTGNRAIVDARVEQFKADLEDGEWAFNGDAIRFAPGKLLDGQHRLRAVSLSGISLRSIVVVGLDAESQVTMDTGRVRSARDVLSIEGLGKWEASVFGSAVHAIIEALGPGGRPWSTVRHINRDVRDFYLEHSSAVLASLRFLHGLPRKPTPIPFSRAMTMHFLFARVDRELADDFFQRLFVGDNLKSNSPVYHLRQRLLNDLVTKNRRSSYIECAYLIKAWNAMRQGRNWKTNSPLYPKENEELEIA